MNETIALISNILDISSILLIFTFFIFLFSIFIYGVIIRKKIKAHDKLINLVKDELSIYFSILETDFYVLSSSKANQDQFTKILSKFSLINDGIDQIKKNIESELGSFNKSNPFMFFKIIIYYKDYYKILKTLRFSTKKTKEMIKEMQFWKDNFYKLHQQAFLSIYFLHNSFINGQSQFSSSMTYEVDDENDALKIFELTPINSLSKQPITISFSLNLKNKKWTIGYENNQELTDDQVKEINTIKKIIDELCKYDRKNFLIFENESNKNYLKNNIGKKIEFLDLKYSIVQWEQLEDSYIKKIIIPNYKNIIKYKEKLLNNKNNVDYINSFEKMLRDKDAI